MSRHSTFRGTVIDMDSLRRENEKTIAVGNMSVNARGDRVKNGVITKTAEEIARENHRVQPSIMKGASLKDVIDNNSSVMQDAPVADKKEDPKAKPKKVQKELPNGDIVEE